MENAIGNSASARNPLLDFASSVVSVNGAREMAEKIVSQSMEFAGAEFCAVYMKRQRYFHLTSLKSAILLKLPSKIGLHSEFSEFSRNHPYPYSGNDTPKLLGIPVRSVLPLLLKGHFLGFMVLGPGKSEKLTAAELDTLAKSCQEFAVNLLVSYFEEHQKMAEEKYQLHLEKERLESASQISEAYRHELGNIINIISLASSGLMADEGYRPTKKMLDTVVNSIRSNVKRAQHIFNAIARYNEQVRLPFHYKNIVALMEEVLSSHHAELSGQHVSLARVMPGSLGVAANENLKDALKYIIQGALHALEHHSPEEKILSVSVRKDQGMARIEISDTGSDATANPFYRGVSVERGKDGGLHYFIARKIIFDHHGTFELSSFCDGKGTTCTLTLRLCDTFSTAELFAEV